MYGEQNCSEEFGLLGHYYYFSQIFPANVKLNSGPEPILEHGEI